MTPAEIRAHLNDLQTCALTLWGEARSEPLEGIQAVASVIRNRVMHPKRYSATYKGVCLQHNQFSCWIQGGGAANYLALLRLAERVVSEPVLPVELVGCARIAEGVMTGALPDNTGGATHYYNPAAVKRQPAWAVGHTPSAKIGHHWFFAGIA